MGSLKSLNLTYDVYIRALQPYTLYRRHNSCRATSFNKQKPASRIVEHRQLVTLKTCIYVRVCVRRLRHRIASVYKTDIVYTKWNNHPYNARMELYGTIIVNFGWKIRMVWKANMMIGNIKRFDCNVVQIDIYDCRKLLEI